MTKYQKIFLVLLRLALGGLFLYSGFTKITDPAFSAGGYLNSAANFTGFYHWLAQPNILPLVGFLNSWGQFALGLSLVLGIFVPISTVLGAAMMILYWLPLNFPHPDAHSYIVDEHIVYATALLLLGSLNAGKVWGLENWVAKTWKTAKK